MEITKKIPVLILALQGKWDSINIGVGAIAALGDPSHIRLLRNMKEKSLAVVACDGKDNMSTRVPESFLELHKSFKIHSKQFVYEILTGWVNNPVSSVTKIYIFIRILQRGCIETRGYFWSGRMGCPVIVT